MAKLYSATSLDDIATLFDQRANIALQQAKRMTILRQAALYNLEVSVWQTAAAILRDTDLRLPPQELPVGDGQSAAPASEPEDDEPIEQLAAFMIRNGFATGHGDTFADLLSEIEWQIQERADQWRKRQEAEGGTDSD